MRWRTVALISLGLNVIFAWVGMVYLYRAPGRAPKAGATLATTLVTNIARPDIVIRRQYFSWREVESPDYAVYIANLKDIGCPEQTIRDIIIADVNALFARRRATEIITPMQQWWRTEPDTNVVRAAAEKLTELESERRTLLARLLGPGWESGDLISLPRPSRTPVALDGPILGSLNAETKQVVQQLNARSADRLEAYLREQEASGEDPDPAELAKLEAQTRLELAQVLTPQQLEEFLLRYSDNANSLRQAFGQLRFFNPTPDEFRAVFRATDRLDLQIAQIQGEDQNSVLARRALEEQREAAIKVALGPKRYEQYRLLQDPVYRDAMETAQQAGTPEAARTIYEINLATLAEQGRIAADTNLTAEQKNVEMKRVELEQLRANTAATGQEPPPEPAPAPQPPPKRTYTLRQGDTVAVVSMIYGVPVSAIRAANPGVDVGRLKPGDTLNIPRNPLGTPPSAPPPP
jgi:LysM repeat protein